MNQDSNLYTLQELLLTIDKVWDFVGKGMQVICLAVEVLVIHLKKSKSSTCIIHSGEAGPISLQLHLQLHTV
jgi:hypothetical protein